MRNEMAKFITVNSEFGEELINLNAITRLKRLTGNYGKFNTRIYFSKFFTKEHYIEVYETLDELEKHINGV